MKDPEPAYDNVPGGCTKPGIMARFKRRRNLPVKEAAFPSPLLSPVLRVPWASLAVMAAILAAFLLSWPQVAAADTKPTIKFSYYSSELEEDSQRHLQINIDPPLENASTALIIVLNESEVRETLSGDTRAADYGYTNTGYAERNADYSVPSSVDLPAGEKSVSFQFTILGDEIVEGEEIFILKLVEFDGSPYAVTSDVNYSRTRVLVVDDEEPVLPDNLGVTMSIGGTQTDTGLSSKVTIKGDCPPVGGLRVQMKRPNESWPEGPGNGSHSWPGGSTDDSGYSLNEVTGCGGETGEISVDGIAPGEEWDVRAYVWQADTPNAISTAAASGFSQVYRVVGWGVPSAVQRMTLVPGVEQLGVTWTQGVAVGTDVPVTAHIRWRTAQEGSLGQPDYVAAGAWNADDGVATDTPTSHTITGLTGGTFYDVEVRSVTPVGNGSWSLTGIASAYRAAAAPEVTPSQQPAESDTPADSDTDANPVTLPDNLSVTVSKGNMTTPAGTSTKVTITGDCPPNGGGFRFQMKRSSIEWPTADPTTHHETWPGPNPAHSQGYPISELRECGARNWAQISQASVDGISPGEEWDLRVYARRFEANDDGPAYSDFSQVYRVVGWTVPDAPTGLSITSSAGQLSAKWNAVAAVGTDMTVTTHIRWRTAQVGTSGETGYAAAGPWNAENGVATDTPTSHTITGLAAGTAYDVELRATSPMGSSQWVGDTPPTQQAAESDTSDDSNTDTSSSTTDSGADDNSVTLPDNLSLTMSKGNKTTATGPSTMFTVDGDCPPNGGVLILQMKRPNEEWPAEGLTSYHVAPLGMSMYAGGCPTPALPHLHKKFDVDGIAPGEEWDVRVYVWRIDDDTTSDDSQVYRIAGWTVPGAPTGVSVTPGEEQLAVTVTLDAIVGTDMPVSTHIRWRTAQAGNSGETGYAAAGAWNAEDGVATDAPTSHTITGLTAGTDYDVEVKFASPMGSSLWAAGTGETLPPDDTDGGNGSGTDDTDSQVEIPVPAVAFGHEKIGDGKYWASVNEGDTLTVTLTFTSALAQDSSIRWYNAAHHGEHGGSAERYGREESSWLQHRNDYNYNENPADREIALTAGMTSATFTISTIEDTLVEGDESFHVHLCGPPPRCDWPFAPPEPHPSRQRILDWLEATEDHYQDVKDAPELVVTIVDDDAPGPVSAVTLTATADSITASWTAPATGGVESYIVHLNPADGDMPVQTAEVEADETTVTFSDLKSGTAYQVKVLARNDAGKSEWTISRITLPEA